MEEINNLFVVSAGWLWSLAAVCCSMLIFLVCVLIYLGEIGKKQKKQNRKPDQKVVAQAHKAPQKSQPVVIGGVKKYTLQESYAQLPKPAKEYFDGLKAYAQTKPLARVKEAKTYLNVGVGNKLYLQLTIKRNIVVAGFNLENEELLMLRLNGDRSIKPEQTKVKVVDAASYETATKMIDLRVEQVAAELAMVRDLRREKQKQRYEASKQARLG